MIQLILIALFPHVAGRLTLRGRWAASSSPDFLIGSVHLAILFALQRAGIISIAACQWICASASLIGLLLGFARHIRTRFREARWLDLAGLTAIFALLLSVGAYYEMPSDPIDHLMKVYFEGYIDRIAYFWMHLALGSMPRIDAFRFDLWQAVAGGLLAWEIVKLTVGCWKSRVGPWLAVLASLAFFGTNLFSYYRYYPFATGFYALLTYLGYLGVLLEALERRRWTALLVISPVAAYFCLVTHAQELLFLLVAGTALPVFAWAFSHERPRKALICLGAFVVIGSAILTALDWLRPSLFPLEFRQNAFAVDLADPMSSAVHRTLGIPGYLALGFSAWLALDRRIERRARLFGGLCLAFALPVFFPPSAYVMSRVFKTPYLLYRMFYGALYWIPLAVGLERLSARLFPRLAPALTAIAIVAAGIIREAPFFSRIDHLLFRADPWYDPRAYIESLRYLASQTEEIKRKRCGIHTDINGRIALGLFSEFGTSGTRYHRSPMHLPPRKANHFLSDLYDQPACFIMLRKPVDLPRSWIAAESGHWHPATALPSEQVHADYWKLIESSPYVFEKVFEGDYTVVFKLGVGPPILGRRN